MGVNKTVKWLDAGREPRAVPDPRYPDGIDIDLSNGKRSCLVQLPYPAQRCGSYIVSCQCGMRVGVTTAGRRDDPRSVKIGCKP